MIICETDRETQTYKTNKWTPRQGKAKMGCIGILGLTSTYTVDTMY